MLIKKDTNSTNGSAAVIPLTTAYCEVANVRVYNNQPTFAFKDFITTDDVYFPGNHPIVYCEHQSYNYGTTSFEGVNQVKTGNSYAGTTDVGSTDFYYAPGDAFQRLQDYVSGDDQFKFEFNRIENWLDFVVEGYSDPKMAYLNFYGTESNTAVAFSPTNYVDKYVESGGNVVVAVSNTEAGAVPTNQEGQWRGGNSFTFSNYGFIDIDSLGQQILTGIVTNTRIYADHTTAEFTAKFSCQGSRWREHVARQHGNFRIDECDSCTSNGHYLNFFRNGTKIINSTFYTSGLTANLTDITKSNNSSITGDDLYFYFNTTGSYIDGTVHKGAQYTSVTANVKYTKEINGVVTHDVTEYHWYNSTGSQVYLGGGGGWKCSAVIDPLERDSKNIKYPKNKIDVNILSTEGRFFEITPHDCIPDYFGGAMLFSGSNLDSLFNVVNPNVPKYFCIGLKGIAASSTSDFSTNNTYNWACKLYKFNSDHFKKISTNTYAFFDDKISRLYNTLDYNDISGNQTRTFTPIGPFFMKLSGESKYKNADGNMISHPFYISNVNIIAEPDILDTMNYITSAKIETNINSRYIISKPAGSIGFGSKNSGHDVNRGNTDDYSYLAVQYPVSFILPDSVYFNLNVTEITNLGTCMSSVSSLRKNGFGSFQQLTAIKSNWENCGNLKDMQYLFSYAFKLEEIPSSWKGLSSLTAASNMFCKCSSLSSIPTDLFTYCTSLNYCQSMFEDCLALTSDIKPIIDYIMGHFYPGATGVYQSMFKGCTGIHSGSKTYAQIIADTSTTAYNSYYKYIFGLN